MKWLLVLAVLGGAFFLGYKGMNKNVYACMDDTDCRVLAIKDCCGFTTQGCYSRAASEMLVQLSTDKSCQTNTVNCSQKPAPAAYCKCNDKKACETVKQ